MWVKILRGGCGETLNQGPRIIPANHTPESYPESYPRIIPPRQTSRKGRGILWHPQMLSNVHSLLQVFSPGFSGDQLFSTVVKWFHPASTVFSCSRLISNVPNWFHLLSTVFKFCHLFPHVFDPLHLSSSALASAGLFWFWMAWFQLCPLDLNCYHCGELRCTQDGASDPEKLLQTNLTSRCQKSSKMRREKQIISSILAPSLLGHCWLLTVLLVVHLWSGIFTRKYRPLDFWSLILVPQYVHHI